MGLRSESDELAGIIASALNGRCNHCLRPLATSEDWDRYDDGEGAHLCWEEPRWNQCSWTSDEGVTREAIVAEAILTSDWLARRDTNSIDTRTPTEA